MADSPQNTARTVIVSSRIDELGSSRRAAFRAVHDEGWMPLLYETEPAEWLAAEHRAAHQGELARLDWLRQSINEELTIDALLRADHFIGIYGMSLGDPSARFRGLRPLEYEFLRFLMAHVWHEQGNDLKVLAKMFRPSLSPDDIAETRNDLRKALRDVTKRSSLYHKVFRERMVFFLKGPPSDVPTSSLMYSTIYRLHRSPARSSIKFFRSGFTKITGGVVYWRPSSQLYLKIRYKIQRWQTKPLRRVRRTEGKEIQLEIETQGQKIGFVFRVVRAIFYQGYTVRELCLGLKKNGDRVMYVKAFPYLHSRKGLAGALEQDNYEVRPVRACPKLGPFPSAGQRWILKATVADRPGMLARTLAPLAHLEMQVLKIDITPYKKEGVTGPLNLVKIIFSKSKQKRPRKRRVLDQGFPLPKKPQFAVDFIAADLTSQPGFYSVDLSGHYGDEASKSSPKRTWPIIGVADVQASSRWYQTLLSAANNHPGDPPFAQVLDEDGTVLLCLHHWGDHGHPTLMSPGNGTPGNGLLLFFCVSDFDSAFRNARILTAQLAEEPRLNPNTHALEFSLQDPDGYYVTVSAFQPT